MLQARKCANCEKPEKQHGVLIIDTDLLQTNYITKHARSAVPGNHDWVMSTYYWQITTVQIPRKWTIDKMPGYDHVRYVRFIKNISNISKHCITWQEHRQWKAGHFHRKLVVPAALKFNEFWKMSRCFEQQSTREQVWACIECWFDQQI